MVHNIYSMRMPGVRGSIYVHLEMWSTESSFFTSIRWWWFMATSWYGNAFSITHYSDVIIGAMASQITSLKIIYSTVYSDADHRKHQSSAFTGICVRGIHRGPVNSPHKWPVTREMFPFDDVIMFCSQRTSDAGGLAWTNHWTNSPVGGDMTLAWLLYFWHISVKMLIWIRSVLYHTVFWWNIQWNTAIGLNVLDNGSMPTLVGGYTNT